MVPKQIGILVACVALQYASRALGLGTIASVTIVLLFYVIATKFLGGAGSSQLTGQPAPSISSLQFVRGDPVKLDQVTVVEFWATWCPPCRDAIPHLNKVYRHFHPKGVDFVGVSQEDEGTVKGFITKLGDDFTYPVALDVGGGVSKAYGVSGIPAAFVVSGGKVVWSGHPRNGLEAELEKAIAGASAKVVETAPMKASVDADKLD